MKKLLSVALLAIALASFAFTPPALAGDATNGGKIFNANCVACHRGGNNVVIASKTLKKSALEKYKMFSNEAVVKQVTKGKSAMPAFGGRLTKDQIEDVATYVLEQAEKGW